MELNIGPEGNVKGEAKLLLGPDNKKREACKMAVKGGGHGRVGGIVE